MSNLEGWRTRQAQNQNPNTQQAQNQQPQQSPTMKAIADANRPATAVRDFVKGVTATNPGSIPLTPGGAVGAAVRLVYEVIKSTF